MQMIHIKQLGKIQSNRWLCIRFIYSNVPSNLQLDGSLRLTMLTTQTIQQAENDLKLAMLRSDSSQLNQLIDEQFMFVLFDGSIINKQQELALYQTSQLTLTELALFDQRIVISNDHAIVTVKAKITTDYAGKKSHGHYSILRVWVQRGDTLKVISGQSMSLGH